MKSSSAYVTITITPVWNGFILETSGYEGFEDKDFICKDEDEVLSRIRTCIPQKGEDEIPL